MSSILRQQLRDLARKALPDLDWQDDIQGSRVILGSFELSLISGGGPFVDNDTSVWLGLRNRFAHHAEGFVYHRTLRRGYGLTNVQGGANPDAPLGDPFVYLERCLQEAHGIAQRLNAGGRCPGVV